MHEQFSATVRWRDEAEATIVIPRSQCAG